MNKTLKNINEQRKGFTIIEVVLVLAIAGLIFLMVFIALPALQRGQRDTQRKNDLSRINTQISNYESSNRGAVPLTTAIGTFQTQYLTPATEYNDPDGTPYTLTAETTVPVGAAGSPTPPIGTIYYAGPTTAAATTGYKCSGSDIVSTTGSRKFALRMKLEGQSASYCIDNQ